MANGHGGTRRGAGRRKNSLNKHKSSFRTELRDYCEKLGVDPHRFMAEMIADDSEVIYGVDPGGQAIMGPAVKKELKFNAARELAQYLEPKLRAMEVSGEITHDTYITVTLG